MTRQPTLKQRLEGIVQEMARRGIRLQEAQEELERLFLVATMRECDGNQSRAAERLRIHRNTLRRRLDHHGLL